MKVALLAGEQAGILHLMPVEISPWGLVGQDLMVITCLVAGQGKGVGRALVAAAVEETRRQGRKGVATVAYPGESVFMPAAFFEKCGFQVVASLEDAQASAMPVVPFRTDLLWQPLSDSASPPRFLRRIYHFKGLAGEVVVDLFWSGCCMAMDVEAHRVREVVAEYGGRAILRDHCSDDAEVRRQYGIVRGILVNGRDICWGGPTSKQTIRDAIDEAMKERPNLPDAGGGL